MKSILKTIIALFLSLFILSCSKDDGPKKEYYPTKITTLTPSSPTGNATTTFEYDSKNRISKFVYEKSADIYIFEMTYDSNDRIQTIVSNKTTSSGNNIVTFNCTYTNSILSQIVLIGGSLSSSFNFNYDNSTNKYTIESSSSTPNYFTLDSNGNLIESTFAGIFISLSYNNNKGIYNSNKNCLPMFFASMVNGFEPTLLYSYYFANKEIATLNFAITNDFNTIVTRDSKNNISEFSLKNSSTNEIVTSASIEYELR
jgi:hypothetical protein